jgi:hypothetical protein
MVQFTNVDPAKLQVGATNTAASLGELESHLSGLSNAQDELAVAVRGATGTAANQALINAYTAGKSLGGTLQEIIDALTDAGVKIDASDLDAAGQVHAKAGADGHFDAGSGVAAASKVNLSSL